MEEAEIERLLEKTYDQLYIDTFNGFPVEALGAIEPSDEEKLREAKNWIDERRQELRTVRHK